MVKKPPVLNYRQKALIGLLKAFGGRLSHRHSVQSLSGRKKTV
jgi:hypothetical protein